MDNCATHYTYSINNPFIDLAVLNALCSKIEIHYISSTDNVVKVQKFERGELKSGVVENASQKCNSFIIKFELDKAMWGNEFSIQYNYVTHEIREFAYLNRGVKFILKYKVEDDKSKVIYKFKNGLTDKIEIEKLNRLGQSFLNTSIERTINDINVEIAFAFKGYQVDMSYMKSYVNEIYTCENGTHVDGLIQGIKAGIIKYFEECKLEAEYNVTGNKIADNLIGAIHVKFNSPIFGGSVKNQLVNSEILNPISNLVSKVVLDRIKNSEEISNLILKLFEE